MTVPSELMRLSVPSTGPIDSRECPDVGAVGAAVPATRIEGEEKGRLGRAKVYEVALM